MKKIAAAKAGILVFFHKTAKGINGSKSIPDHPKTGIHSSFNKGSKIVPSFAFLEVALEIFHLTNQIPF